MSMTRQTILASRPAAMVLALSLVAGLTAPFVMLPHIQVASAATTCTENNHNGCTELSPTPPEDTVSVPPNIMLMLDDSGSMSWNFMPDWSYLQNNGNNDAVIDASNNGVYYNPTITYSPPPQNNGTSYTSQTDISNVPEDGFGVRTTASVNLLTYSGNYDYYQCGGGVCGGSAINYNTSQKVKTTQTVTANYDNYASSQNSCKNTYNSNNGFGNYTYTAHSGWWRFNGNWYNGGGECQFQYHDTQTTYQTYYFFQYSTGPAAGPYTVYYVTANAADCANAPTPANCVGASDTSGAAAPAGIAAGTNIANWFAYYHTRILMAKSGLMTAFNNLDPNYRFGFGSIDGNNDYAIKSLGSGNYVNSNGFNLAVVAPFGAAKNSNGTDNTGSQRYNFWNWIANESAGSGTPLQTALQSVGNYYKTSQPWTTMSSDPGYTTGSTTQFACRASYTILTTDGFWNGASPNVGNVDGKNGPTYSPPAGKTYTVTGYVAAQPYSDSISNTLADVAMYYWENDLQPTIPNEVAPSTADPAFWQHMTTFTMGLGFTPTGINPSGTTISQIFAWAQGGAAISGFSWPTPSSDSINNIADLAHAAVNGHGDFFSVKSPQELAAGFSKAISDINSRNVPPSTAGVNSSVLSVGALSFETGYNTGDWSGALEAATLKTDGTVDKVLWLDGKDPNLTPPLASQLDDDYHSATGYKTRNVFTDAYDSTKSTPFTTFQFIDTNSGSLDTTETAGLKSPALSGTNDTLLHRIDYLLGDDTYEGTTYRTRNTILGAIIRSEPVYVSSASGNYYDSWPTIGGIAPPEAATGAQSYDTFVTNESTRAGMVYVGANDGMLHAFNAPVPTCSGTIDSNGNCSSYTFQSGANPGKEAWAFVPRAVYANLGNLTSAANFQFRPTVDAAPVTRDVFFSQADASGNTHDEWHTILAGGVGMGGRGVYALDITDPTSFSASDVLWEFDSDMTPSTGCVASYGSCKATDLGYTVSQPNIGRLSDGKWVVIVPNGYFPDCSTPDIPTADNTTCQNIAAQAPKDSSGNPYSALFVLDAQTGKMLAELKTPTNISGVTSFGLATPVMGDYNSDQVDDVAFAGDVQGNLWRFDLSSTSATGWTVTLVYKGIADSSGNQGVQPITSMPRLFPDASTNRFMVVFGTGKFLGVGDNSSTDVQAIYGVRDDGNTYTQSDLTQQYLHETVVPTGQPNAGASLRCVTGSASDTSCTSSSTPPNAVPASSGGWYINLQTKTSDGTVNDAGERVVVNPGAIFASNTVVFETLITGSQSSDPCSPSTQGAIMALNATTGSPAGVSSLGGSPIVGGRINNARTSGSLPVVSALGGGQAYLPGVTLAPSGSNPLSIDAPIWRRRSWSEINENQ